MAGSPTAPVEIPGAPLLPVEGLARLARLVGLSPRQTPTLSLLGRRRWQWWVLLAGLLFGTSVVVALTVLSPELAPASPLGSSVPVVGMVVLSFAFVAYVVEKERNLRQLAALVRGEQQAREHLGLQLHKLEAVLAATATLSRTADPAAVERLVLQQAVELVRGASGVVYGRRGTEFALLATTPTGLEPSGLLASAARAADAADGAHATLPVGPGQDGLSPVVSVALRYEGVSVALLATQARAGEDFDEVGLALLSAFAEHAGTAMMNARRYAEHREVFGASTGLTSVEAEFEWLSGDGA